MFPNVLIYDSDSIYLDHAGSTVPSKALMDAFAADMTYGLYGNPHSGSWPSQLSTTRVDDIRLRLLNFFNADPDEFDLVFVANTTAGVKLVLDGLRGLPNGYNYVHHQACHTSLIGAREEAKNSVSLDDTRVQSWIGGSCPFSEDTDSASATLFAYTAQSHMDGKRYPLSWAGKIKGQQNSQAHRIYTLIDVASFTATSKLDMSHPDYTADFTVLSLYKIFGFPDLGALIVRKSAEEVFESRKYFGGGTVDMVVCGKEQWHARKAAFLHERLEDGTLPFHNIMAAGAALTAHEELFGSMDRVSAHTSHLTRQMYDGLRSLQHGNGQQVCTLYSADAATAELGTGPVISFNIRSSVGAWVSLAEFEKLAILKKVHVRTGGLCSPGGIMSALELEPWEMKKNFSAGFRCGMDNDLMNGKPVGVIRASLGAMSTRADVDGFLEFMREFYVEPAPVEKKPEEVYRTTSNPVGQPSLRVKTITVYPIKSCGGFTVPNGVSWDVRPEGLAWDREWCLIHRGSGQALSQKRYTKMALLRPHLDFTKGVLRVEYIGTMSKRIPNTISIPLSANPALFETSCRQKSSRVCGDEISTQIYNSEEINDFFSAALDVPCVLARFPPGGRGLSSRTVKVKMQRHQQSDVMQRLLPGSFPDDIPSPPDSDTEQNQGQQQDTRQEAKMLLANESPILAIHTASVAALNEEIVSRGGTPVTEASFRANIVLEGLTGDAAREKEKQMPSAFAEDFWKKVRIGPQRFVMLGACRRCHMVCVDQETGEKNVEPFVTLSKTRRFDGKVFFGAHMMHQGRDGPAGVSVGEEVIVD